MPQGSPRAGGRGAVRAAPPANTFIVQCYFEDTNSNNSNSTLMMMMNGQQEGGGSSDAPLLTDPAVDDAHQHRASLLLRLGDRATALDLLRSYFKFRGPAASGCHRAAAAALAGAPFGSAHFQELAEKKVEVRVAHGDGSPNMSLPALFPYHGRRAAQLLRVADALSREALLVSTPSTSAAPPHDQIVMSPQEQQLESQVLLKAQEGMTFPFMVHISDSSSSSSRTAATKLMVVDDAAAQQSPNPTTAHQQKAEVIAADSSADLTLVETQLPRESLKQILQEASGEIQSDGAAAVDDQQLVRQGGDETLSRAERRRLARIARQADKERIAALEKKREEALRARSELVAKGDVEELARCAAREAERYDKWLAARVRESERHVLRQRRRDEIMAEARQLIAGRLQCRKDAEEDFARRMQEALQEMEQRSRQKKEEVGLTAIIDDSSTIAVSECGVSEGQTGEGGRGGNQPRRPRPESPLTSLLAQLEESMRADVIQTEKLHSEERAQMLDDVSAAKYQEMMRQAADKRRELRGDVRRAIAEKKHLQIEFQQTERQKTAQAEARARAAQEQRVAEWHERRAAVEAKAQEMASEQLQLQQYFERHLKALHPTSSSAS